MAGAKIVETTLVGRLNEGQRDSKLPVYECVSGTEDMIDFLYLLNRDVFKTRVSLGDGSRSELSTGEPLDMENSIKSTVSHIQLDQFWQLLKREANKINITEFFNIDGCIRYSDSRRDYIAIVKDNGVGPYTVFSYINEIGRFQSFDDALDYARNYAESPLESMHWLEQKQIDTLEY